MVAKPVKKPWKKPVNMPLLSTLVELLYLGTKFYADYTGMSSLSQLPHRPKSSGKICRLPFPSISFMISTSEYNKSHLVTCPQFDLMEK